MDALATRYQNLRARMDKKEDHMWEFFFILPANIRAQLLTKIPTKINSLEKLILEASTLEKSDKLKKRAAQEPGSHKNNQSHNHHKQQHKGNGSNHSNGNGNSNGTARSSHLLSITSSKGVRKVTSAGPGVVPQDKRYALLASVPTPTKDQRMKDNLCMYCGKPNHYIDTCRKAL